MTLPCSDGRTVYIAGPITGMADNNAPAFYDAEERWAQAGWLVVNPLREDERDPTGSAPDQPPAYYYRRDLPKLLASDAVALLPGWGPSVGANIERNLAIVAGICVLDAMTGERVAETISDEAVRHVRGDRNAVYGPPTEAFVRIGRMWGAVLGIEDVAPAKVGLCMAAYKIAREAAIPRRDNRVDAVGYLETVDWIEEVS